MSIRTKLGLMILGVIALCVGVELLLNRWAFRPIPPLLMTLAMSGVMLGTLYLLLRRTVVVPLARLSDFAADVKGQARRQRGRYGCSDEIRQLEETLDGAAQRIRQSNRRLTTQTRQLNRAGVSSRFLHDICNALTPLAGRLEMLREDLNSVPLEHLQEARLELAGNETDASRKEDLLEYLALGTDRLMRVVDQGRSQMDLLINITHEVEAMIRNASPEVRARGVVESVPLAELVSEAARIAREESVRPGVVHVDRSVERVGEVRVEIATVREVLVNLLEFAFDYARRTGRGERIASVSAKLSEDGDLDPWLVVSVPAGTPGQSDLDWIFDEDQSGKNILDRVDLSWARRIIRALGGEIELQATDQQLEIQVAMPEAKARSGK